MKRIMFITRFLYGGGAERVVSVISNALVGLGHEVGVLIYIRHDNEYELKKQVTTYSLLNYDENTGNSFSRVYRRYYSLRKTVSQYKPDVVIPFMEDITRDVFFALEGTGFPIVGTVRDTFKNCGKVKSFIRNYVYLHCYKVWVQTSEQQHLLPKDCLNKSFILANPLPMEFTNECNKKTQYIEEPSLFISVGRLEPQKNHEMLIRAFQKYYLNHHNARLDIYGDGSIKQQLQNLIEGLSLIGIVNLKGRSDKIYKNLKKADIFILSSNHEGMPNALMEAMSIGVPCISTDCPTGPKELIGQDERGYLVNTDDINGLAECMEDVFCDYNSACKKAIQARQFMKRFEEKEIAARLLEEVI